MHRDIYTCASASPSSVRVGSLVWVSNEFPIKSTRKTRPCFLALITRAIPAGYHVETFYHANRRITMVALKQDIMAKYSAVNAEAAATKIKRAWIEYRMSPDHPANKAFFKKKQLDLEMFM